MTINYTPLLSLAEPVTGTQSGTWGDDVNQGLTDYLDIAVAGAQVISGSQTAVTLSKTTGSSAGSNIAQVGSAGTTGTAQYAIINCTGNPASILTITAPTTSKTYVVINSTSTNQSVKLVGPGPTVGVTIPNGKTFMVAWNGSDFALVTTVISKRVVSVASASSVTPNADITDILIQANTEPLGTLTINAPIGSPTNGQAFVFRLSSTAVQTFSWNAIYQGSTDGALPAASSGAGKTDYMGFIYNSTSSKWQMLAKNFGF